MLAGYTADMDRLLRSNPGLASRFSTRITFPSYSAAELSRIAQVIAAQAGDSFDAEAVPVLDSIFIQAVEAGRIDTLGNGRFARSLFERACASRDVRVSRQGRRRYYRILTTVTAGDLLAAYQELAGAAGYAKGASVTPACSSAARTARARLTAPGVSPCTQTERASTDRGRRSPSHGSAADHVDHPGRDRGRVGQHRTGLRRADQRAVVAVGTVGEGLGDDGQPGRPRPRRSAEPGRRAPAARRRRRPRPRRPPRPGRVADGPLYSAPCGLT